MQNTSIFLQGGGRLGELFRSTDWSSSSLGNPDQWPDTLKSAISISLNSGFPIAVYWGPQFILLYNDAYSAIPGDKHPWALGKPGNVAWAEIWDGLDAEFRSVLYQGQSIRRPDALLLMNRYGYTEECYFDYTLSPIIAPDGTIGGVFNAVIETSYRVINDRRNRVVQQLLQQLNQAHDLQEANLKVQTILEKCPEDIVFFQLYSTENEHNAHLQLTAYSGSLDQNTPYIEWPYFDPQTNRHITNLNRYVQPPVNSVWGEPCTEALIVPISTGEAKINGYLVMGLSPRKRLDTDYEQFLTSVAIHTGTILNNSYAYEQSGALQREQALNEELAAANEELNTTNEELHQSRQSLSQLNAELESRIQNRTQALQESEKRFRSLIEQSPVPILVTVGPKMMLDVVNPPMLALIDKTPSVTGKPLFEAMPELIGQPIIGKLQQVYESGETWIGYEQAVVLNRNNQHATGYFNVVYKPLVEDGVVTGVIQSAVDVTEQVNARKLLEKSIHDQQALNEELMTTNEELASANEEMVTTNEALANTRDNLKQIVNQLAESEARLRYMLADAPIAIALLTGPELIVEAANKKILEAWGKNDQIVGMPVSQALPEINGQVFLDLLNNVYATGQPYYGNEVKALLEQDGIIEEVYTNFVYHPLKNEAEETNSIIVVANIVTEQVLARKKIEQAEEMLRFTIDAAKVGTWYINPATHEFRASTRLKELFGFNPDEEVAYDDVVKQIPEDYRHDVQKAVSQAITHGGNYEVEHPVIGFHDQKLRWVRALGKLNQDTKGNNAYFSGVMIDITEQKQDEVRKNDFIGMVSHELKTPLTSLSAYTQMLHARALKNNDGFTSGALDKVNLQVKKMSTLINGFLNVSRLEAGKIHLDIQRFRLDELLQEMLNEARQTVSSHQILLHKCAAITIYADRDKIGSVISNLLSNAVKYSPKGKKIEVTCNLSNDTVSVSVKDEGMGIKPQDAERLFERYYRVNSKHTQTISGFGIGLYLCAEIIQRHDGKIWVDSEVGVGSTFHFSLPVG